jgi:thiamine-phosphate pyrophosphorylase
LKFQLPKIYPITDVRICGLSHAEQVKRLITGGAAMIQLRDKDASPMDFYQAALEALEIGRRHGVKILINDRVDIALAIRADGVHLGQEDLSPGYARKLLGEKAIIGYSTHSVGQAREAVGLSVDYIAIGPLFHTRTKENPDDVIGLGGIRDVREAIGEFPLVAIGGIDAENIGDTLKAGADSAAIIRYLLSDAEDIIRKMRELTARCGF